MRLAVFHGAVRQPHLQRTVERIKRCGALQVVQVVGVQREVVARLIDRSPDQQQQRRADSERTRCRRAAHQPAAHVVGEVSAGFGGGIGDAFARIQEQRCDPAVAQLPDGAIQNEVVDIHQRREDQEAGGEVMMKRAAGQPRAGHKQRDAAEDQHAEIGQWPPVARRACSGYVPRLRRRLHGAHSNS